MVPVELVYIPYQGSIVHFRMQVKEGTTVEDVVNQSGILALHPEVSELSIGIFSKRVDKNKVVKAGDRIEIYRELLIDPMEKRRQRARVR